MINGIRLDIWLWRSRFYKTRGLAQKACLKGHIRINRRRVVKCHYTLKEGDVLTLPHGKKIRVIRVVVIPERRGPASEAQNWYEDLTSHDTI